VRPSSRAVLNIVLLALVAAVGAYIYFKPGDSAQPGQALIPGALEDVARIEIERASGMRIALARTDGQWRMQAPVSARLDEIALARVLELARARSEQRMPAAELGRFELDRPWARVRFDQHGLEFGMSNALTHELYVKSGEEVVTVPARLAANIPADASKLIAHRLFGPQEQPAAFRLERFGVREEAGHWHVEPGPADLSQDDLLRWVDHWRLASSILTQPQTSAPVKHRLEIDLRGGGTVALGVIATTPDLVLRREDERLDYHVPARLAAVLLAPPGSTAQFKP
jgi:hypothetical protein